MRSLLKIAKTGYLLLSALLILAGVGLAFFSDTFYPILAVLLGILFLVFGAVKLACFFSKDLSVTGTRSAAIATHSPRLIFSSKRMAVSMDTFWTGMRCTELSLLSCLSILLMRLAFWSKTSALITSRFCF